MPWDAGLKASSSTQYTDIALGQLFHGTTVEPVLATTTLLRIIPTERASRSSGRNYGSLTDSGSSVRGSSTTPVGKDIRMNSNSHCGRTV